MRLDVSLPNAQLINGNRLTRERHNKGAFARRPAKELTDRNRRYRVHDRHRLCHESNCKAFRELASLAVALKDSSSITTETNSPASSRPAQDCRFRQDPPVPLVRLDEHRHTTSTQFLENRPLGRPEDFSSPR